MTDQNLEQLPKSLKNKSMKSKVLLRTSKANANMVTRLQKVPSKLRMKQSPN